jgi:hypothetical protein
MRRKHHCVSQECEGISGHQTRASKDGQGESFQGHNGKRRESKVGRQMLSKSHRVTTGTCQCLIGSVVKWCLNVIYRITPLTVYRIGGVGGYGHLMHCNENLDLPINRPAWAPPRGGLYCNHLPCFQCCSLSLSLEFHLLSHRSSLAFGDRTPTLVPTACMAERTLTKCHPRGKPERIFRPKAHLKRSEFRSSKQPKQSPNHKHPHTLTLWRCSISKHCGDVAYQN